MSTVKTISILFITALINITNGQVGKNSDLFKTLKTKDHLLFHDGFNTCDLNQMSELITDDIEFYHDKDGRTQSKKSFINSMKQHLCSSGKNALKRVLKEETLEVFPLYKNNKLYAALQKGTHSFGETKASFSHLWLIQNGEWKLSRVISYNHHQEKAEVKTSFLNLTSNELQKYVGVYVFSPEFALTIVIKEGKLYGGLEGQYVGINCYDKDKFIDDEQVHDLSFVSDSDGIIIGLHMEGLGMKMDAKKK
jgi:hypothetical protein